jgi:hypothetical protein
MMSEHADFYAGRSVQKFGGGVPRRRGDETFSSTASAESHHPNSKDQTRQTNKTLLYQNASSNVHAVYTSKRPKSLTPIPLPIRINLRLDPAEGAFSVLLLKLNVMLTRHPKQPIYNHHDTMT